MERFVTVADFEKHAAETLPKNAFDYFRSGAGEEGTLGLNVSAFSNLRIRPRFMVDVSNRDSSISVFGNKISMPIGVAPTAMQKMAHPEGECANARAAGALGTIFTLSTLSTSSIEEVAEAAPNTIKWYQLYIYKDRMITRKLVERPERAGFKALVVTVDAPLLGKRNRDVRNLFQLPPHLRLANFSDEKNDVTNNEDNSALNVYVKELLDQSLTWEDVSWLKSITKLPVILKGILTAEDARIAVNLGVAGIQVSNHGGRQMDSAPASIEALPEIVNAVGNQCEIFLDGGIRNGTDVFKALALGAKMVFVGRPAVWGLAHSGEEGVKKILGILKEEFDLSLALSGATSPLNIKKEMVIHSSNYSKL